MDVGGVEALIVLAVVTGVVAYAFYWVIRLAVNHGVQDAHRYGRVWTPEDDRG